MKQRKRRIEAAAPTREVIDGLGSAKAYCPNCGFQLWTKHKKYPKCPKCLKSGVRRFDQVEAPRPPLVRLYDDELIADLFAGGGGTSTGIEMILGRSPDVAINHDADALAMHQANHPMTQHLRGDVFHYDPDAVANGRRFGFAWFSPDCTFHSKAKGGVPFRDHRRSLRIRGLAWVMVRWAESKVAKPRILFMENVEEWWDWGRLIEVAPGEWRPDPRYKGEYRKRLIRRLEKAGYAVEMRQLRASDFGAPTSRKRMFIIARCDGKPIVWPQPTHGPCRRSPYRTAAECLDFSLPVPSIFLTPDEAKAWGNLHGVPAPRRPLAEATLRRIARGVQRYVIEAADPFIVPVLHQGDTRTYSVYDPIPTITSSHRGEFALIAPTLINTRNGERIGQDPRALDIRRPFTTITALGSQGAMVAAFLAKHNGGHEATGQQLTEPADTIVCRENKALVAVHLQRDFGQSVGSSADSPAPTITAGGGGHSALVATHLLRYNSEKVEGEVRGQALDTPLSTLDTSNRFGLVASSLIKLRGGLTDHVHTSQDVREPIGTLTAGGLHIAEVRAFLIKFFGTGVARSLFAPAGTLTTKDRLGLIVVTVAGEEYVIVDIGMRMLTPRELFRLQGFPSSYVIDRGMVDGKPKKFTKTTQTRLVGNSVPPHLAAAIIGANFR